MAHAVDQERVPMRVLILITDERDEHWNRSAQQIADAVERGIAKLRNPERATVEIIRASDAISDHGSQAACVICHATPAALSAVEARGRKSHLGFFFLGRG